MSAHNIPFQYKKRKISLNYLKSATVRFFQGKLERAVVNEPSVLEPLKFF